MARRRSASSGGARDGSRTPHRSPTSAGTRSSAGATTRLHRIPERGLYFVHSYAGRADGAGDEVVLATTTHGRPFVSAVARGRLLGVQFHPERSGDDGLRLLSNVVAAVRPASVARDDLPVTA